MFKNVIAIDPGKNGGLIFRDTEANGLVLDMAKMPETIKDIIDLLKSWKNHPTHPFVGKCYLEKVGARPMQGAGGMWTFAEGYGALKATLQCLEIPFELVLPNTWQKALSCQTKGDKKVTYRKAQELFPELRITHYNADSLLISEYALRINNKQ